MEPECELEERERGPVLRSYARVVEGLRSRASSMSGVSVVETDEEESVSATNLARPSPARKRPLKGRLWAESASESEASEAIAVSKLMPAPKVPRSRASTQGWAFSG
jgi:hypothetical protein